MGPQIRTNILMTNILEKEFEDIKRSYGHDYTNYVKLVENFKEILI